MTTTTNKLNSIRTASPAAAFAAEVRAILPVLLALLPFGVAFGATAAGIGFSPIETLGMSVFVAAVQLVSAGASAAVVVLTVFIINLRLMLYGASLAPHFRSLPLGWKSLLSFHITDQAYAATITRFDGGKPRSRTSAGTSSAWGWRSGPPGRRRPWRASSSAPGSPKGGLWTSCCP
jgi:predicted branched-subunit amino acid permease